MGGVATIGSWQTVKVGTASVGYNAACGNVRVSRSRCHCSCLDSFVVYSIDWQSILIIKHNNEALWLSIRCMCSSRCYAQRCFHETLWLANPSHVQFAFDAATAQRTIKADAWPWQWWRWVLYVERSETLLRGFYLNPMANHMFMMMPRREHFRARPPF